jgi:hypothetical protein
VSSGTGFCDGAITRQRNPTVRGMSEYDLETSTMSLDPLGLSSHKKCIYFYIKNSSSKKLTNKFNMSLEVIK